MSSQRLSAEDIGRLLVRCGIYIDHHMDEVERYDIRMIDGLEYSRPLVIKRNWKAQIDQDTAQILANLISDIIEDAKK